MIESPTRIASRVEITNGGHIAQTGWAEVVLLFDWRGGGGLGLAGRKHPLLPCIGSHIVMETGDGSIGRQSVGRSNEIVYKVVE